MFRVRIGRQEFLGRRTTGAPLTVVGEAHAYEFDTRAQAQRLADNFIHEVNPDNEVVVEEAPIRVGQRARFKDHVGFVGTVAVRDDRVDESFEVGLELGDGRVVGAYLRELEPAAQ